MIKKTLYVKDGEVVKETDQHFTDAMTAEGYRFPAHKLGARIFADVQFPDDMTDAEIGKMTRLSKLMVGKTNMLGYRKGRRIEAYTAAEITGLVNLKERQGRDFIRKMLRLNVIQQVEINGCQQFYINPAYFMANGQRLSLDLFLLFRNELSPILPQWVIDDFLLQARVKQVE